MTDDTGLAALTPPYPVASVTPEQARAATPLAPQQRHDLGARADAFAAELLALEPRSPAFAAKVTSLSSMGETDLQAAAAMSGRFLSRRATARPGSTTSGYAADVQARVAATLARLREVVVRLDPSGARTSGVRRLLGRLPGADAVGDYFARYRSSQGELQTILTALSAGQDDLRLDNATIDAEARETQAVLARLAEYQELAASLDDRLSAGAARLESAGRTDAATVVRSDAVSAIRQRRTDIATQQAVTHHGVLVLDVVRSTNLELIRGVDRAQRSTLAALRTAVTVSESMQHQSLVLDQIAGLQRASTAAVADASSDGPQDLSALQRAFDDVLASLDAVDTFQTRARDALAASSEAMAGRGIRAGGA